MISRSDKVERFRALHKSGCFVIPNPWDIAGARMMTGLGFKALATTSSGYAFSKGRKDGALDVSRAESLAYAADIAASTDVPVTADLEDGYEDTPEGVPETVRLAAEAGLAGLSIEDRQPNSDLPIRDFDDAVARVAAAAEAARKYNIVLTARADGLGKGAYDLEEAIRRLRTFEAVGVEVLYAPGVPDLASLEKLCRSVKTPVNHVIGQGVSGLTLDQIAQAGVRRISVGGSLARAAGGALLTICREIAAGDFGALDSAPAWGVLHSPKAMI
ncbi:isocitrate lyase/phosphoenolpyruvate mutase family protein [Mesorhizobium sp. C416B]|uniref:isocitrate lyase/PEP mutase family protein n=1 Tax=unclassified Mesorhizobium TaxID=325217 RepID=UPI0003CE7A5B|nr:MULTISPECIES: isocitrate lyase/phosphoenolpyruvate mutase family protein [unclassified Mesorhizobium]ESX43470.1 2-methylisocitrate lyase [Mesorhizobium sp. LSHC426A00]ESX48648.1 2-methylisocitrate lyase [Mesorhizobium sp. LSHC424B00]ESX73544.1 2-methylisocitrate lyase [Mesorhizobium sp. LSHC416B00]WJI65906.1 isocitrate lyase/phosphoenolpyruvate mutase family protein [Mesorhizobium sp. C416B]